MTTITAPACPEREKLRFDWYATGSEKDYAEYKAHLMNCATCRAQIAEFNRRASEPLEVTREMLEALR